MKIYGSGKNLEQFFIQSKVSQPNTLYSAREEIPLNFLAHVLKWPCRLAQIGGYWPFQLVDGAQWEFKWKSFQGVQIALMPIIALSCIVGAWVNKDLLFKDFTDQISETERVGYGITAAISQFGVLALMILTILYRNGIATTWNHLNQLCNETASMIDESNSELGKMAKTKFLKWVSFRLWAANVGISFVLIEAIINVMLAFTEAMPSMFASYGYNQATITSAILLTCWLILFRLYMTFIGILIATLFFISGIYRHLALQVSFLGEEGLEQIVDKQVFTKSPPKTQYCTPLLRRLEQLLRIGDGLEKVMDNLNHKLKMQMLIILSIIGIGLVFNAFTIVVNLDKGLFHESGRKNSAELFCFVIDAIMFTVVCSSASSVTHKAQSFGDELGKLVSSTSLSPGMVSRIQHAACKFSLKPPVFAPGYYFVVNNQLLTSLVAMVTTYLTVLLQFSSSNSCRCTELSISSQDSKAGIE